jgi:hypothetical protein
MPLFEVAIIEVPTKTDAEAGKSERLVVPPKAVCAKDAQTAAIRVSMDANMEIDLDRMQVLVRPFV